MSKERELELLEKQILADAKNGDTTVLAEILEMLDDDQRWNSLSDVNQGRSNFIQLKGGERIKALENLTGVSNSYSTPERIDIPKGTIIRVGQSGTRFGDCFCTLVEGTPILHCRGHNEGAKIQMQVGASGIGLSEGYETAPYSLGQLDMRVWEILK
jgi:hypothetical protein